jgi:hypothetical protein
MEGNRGGDSPIKRYMSTKADFKGTVLGFWVLKLDEYF